MERDGPRSPSQGLGSNADRIIKATHNGALLRHIRLNKRGRFATTGYAAAAGPATQKNTDHSELSSSYSSSSQTGEKPLRRH